MSGYAGWPDERAARTVAAIVTSLTRGKTPTPEDHPEKVRGVAILKQGRADWDDVEDTVCDINNAVEGDPARLGSFYFVAVTVGARRGLSRDRTFETFPMRGGLAQVLEDVREAMLAPDGRTFLFVNMHAWTGYGGGRWPTDEGDVLIALDWEAYRRNVMTRLELARVGALDAL